MQEIEKVITEFPLFAKYSEKEKFFKVLGLLVARQISLAKAAELLGLRRDEFIFLLDKLNIEYSYLDEEEAQREKSAVKRMLEEK
ncbi:MAG: UPF0175 family protein [Candidatus Asgardarchaeia archaeon]